MQTITEQQFIKTFNLISELSFNYYNHNYYYKTVYV